MSTAPASTIHQTSISEPAERGSAGANALSWAILLGGGVSIALAIYIVIVGHSKLPYWDGWMQIEFSANEGPTHTLDWLWRQFNQHRVLIPKLFMLADLRWFRATQTSMLVANLLVQSAHLGLLAWSMRTFGGWRGPLWRAGVGLAAFCLFCPSQWPNLLSGFTGLCCFLPPFFVTLATVGLLLYVRRWREQRRGEAIAWLLLSIVAALGGTYSLSNGNLLWPLLVFGAIALRAPIAGIVALVIAGIAGIAAYFYNYTVYITASSLGTPGTPIALAKYIAVYFGSSWIRNNIRLAEVLGIAGCLVLLFVLAQVPRYFRVAPAFCVELLILLFFVLGTGIVTAPGRFVFGLDQAFSGRYQSFALLFWCCMGLLLLGRLSLSGARNALLFAGVALLAVMIFAVSKAAGPIERARFQGFNMNVAADALITGVPDTEQLSWADSHPELPRSMVAYMREERLSVFAGGTANLLDQRLSSVLQVAPDCRGGVESQKLLTRIWPASLRVSGWAWDPVTRTVPKQLVVVSDGIITGLGVAGDARPDTVKQTAGATTNLLGFSAYVRDVARSASLDVYAVRGNQACKVATFTPAGD